MKINYLQAIIEPDYFDSLVKEFNSSNNDLYLPIFQSALQFIKSKDYIYENEFIDPCFIEWGIMWVISHHDEFIECELDLYVVTLSKLIQDFEGYWFKQEVIDILEKDHFFPENFAITAMVYTIKGLYTNNYRYLSLASKCESLMHFAAIAAKSLLKAEDMVQKRDEGREKAKAKKGNQFLLDNKINELAKAIWLEIPKLSKSSVASNIHDGISNILTSHLGDESKCQAFYELGFYDAVLTNSEKAENGIEHPEDFNLYCIPLKLKSADAIRKQIKSLKPSTTRHNNSSDSIKKIKPILREKLPCSNLKCDCRNKF